MAESILSSLTSKPSFIAKDDSDGSILWSDLGIISVEIGASAAVTDAPLSDAQLTNSSTSQEILSVDVANAKILQPSRMRVSAMCPNIDLALNLISKFNDVNATVSATSKSVLINSMVLTDLEIEHSYEFISAAKVLFAMEQAIPNAAANYSPQQSADSTTYSAGLTVPTATTGLSTLTSTISNSAVKVASTVSNALRDAAGNIFILDKSAVS